MAVYVAARLSPGLPFRELVKVMRIFSIDFHAASNVNVLMTLMTTWDEPMSDDHQYNPEIGPKEEVEEQDDDRHGRNLINSLLADNHNETDIPSTSQVTAHVQSGVVGRIQNGADPVAQPLFADVKEENDDYQMDFGIESGYSEAVDSLQQTPGGTAQFGMKAGCSGVVASMEDPESVGRSAENFLTGDPDPHGLTVGTYLAEIYHPNGRKLRKKDFKCDVCLNTFVSKKNLNVHMKIHERRYQCSVCRKRFEFKSVLRKHITVKKHWKMEDQEASAEMPDDS